MSCGTTLDCWECRVERHCSRKDGTASFSVGLAFKCRGVAGKVVGNDILRRQTRVFGPFRAPRISSKECRVARHSWMAGPSLFTRVLACLFALAF